MKRMQTYVRSQVVDSQPCTRFILAVLILLASMLGPVGM